MTWTSVRVNTLGLPTMNLNRGHPSTSAAATVTVITLTHRPVSDLAPERRANQSHQSTDEAATLGGTTRQVEVLHRERGHVDDEVDRDRGETHDHRSAQHPIVVTGEGPCHR